MGDVALVDGAVDGSATHGDASLGGEVGEVHSVLGSNLDADIVNVEVILIVAVIVEGNKLGVGGQIDGIGSHLGGGLHASGGLERLELAVGGGIEHLDLVVRTIGHIVVAHLDRLGAAELGRDEILVVVAGVAVGGEAQHVGSNSNRTMPRSVDNRNGVGAVAVDGDVAEHRLVVLLEGGEDGQRLGIAQGAGADAHRLGIVVGATAGEHREGVGAVAGETGNGVLGGGDAGGNLFTTIHDDVGHIARVLHVGIPAEGDTVVGNIGNLEVLDNPARGNHLEGDVVDIGSGSSGTLVHTDGHIGVVGRAAGELHTEVSVGATRNGDGLYSREGGEVGGVAHGTHDEGAGSRVAAASPEADHVAVHGVDGDVNGRQHSHLRVGIGGTCGGIELHVDRSTMRHRGAGEQAGVVAVRSGGGVVETSPAEGECFGIGHYIVVRLAFQVVEVRQGDEGITLGAGADGDGTRSVVGSAVGNHSEGVGGVGGEAGDGVGGSGDTAFNQRIAVIDGIGGAGVDGVVPSEGDTIVGSSANCQVGNLEAGRHHIDIDVVDMDVVVAAGGGGLSVESDADGLANVGIEIDGLFHILSAGQRSEGIVATFVLPLGSIGLKPSLTVIGGDEDHESLGAVVLIASGGGSSAISGESGIKRQLGRSSRGQVDVGSNQPIFAAGTIDINTIVTSRQSIADGSLIGPSTTTGIKREGGAIEDLSGSNAGSMSPAGFAGEIGVEGLNERHLLGGAERANRNTLGSRSIRSGAVDSHSKSIISVGIETREGVGIGAGSYGGN